MKLTIRIMPELHPEMVQEDMRREFKPFYTGKNKAGGWIINNALYYVAFLIPFMLLIMMMSHFGFAPFGQNSMFVLNGAESNVPVLTKTIAQLKDGSFSLFTLSGSGGREIFSTLTYYLASPFTLVTLFLSQENAVGLLSLFCVFRIALAAPVFLYYLTHRLIGRQGSKYDVTLLIFALGYALSSYALVQFSDFMYLDCFVLYPLLMLGLERLMKGFSARYFSIVLCLCLLSNFYLGLILILFCTLYYFFCHTDSGSERIVGFFRFLGAVFLAVLPAAVTVVPGMAGLWESVISSSTPASHSFFQNLFHFYSRQFFFSNPSYAHVYEHGINLYAGVLVLPLVALHFLDKRIRLKRRMSDLCFLLIMFLALNDSTISYLFHLGWRSDNCFTAYAFVYLFVLLAWSFDAFMGIGEISIRRTVAGALIPIPLALSCASFAKPTPYFTSINFTVDLLVGIAVLLILYRIGSIKRFWFCAVLAALSLTELMANGFRQFQVISLEEVPLEAVLTREDAEALYGSISKGRSELYQNASMPDFNTNHLFSRFSTNALLSQKESAASDPLSASLAGLCYLYLPAGENAALCPSQYTPVAQSEDCRIYQNNYAFPTAFLFDDTADARMDEANPVSRLNSVARQLGAQADIFVEAPLDFDVKIRESQKDILRYRSLGNQMYAFCKNESALGGVSDAGMVYKVGFSFKAPMDGELFLYTDSFRFFSSTKADEDVTYSLLSEFLFNHDTLVLIKGYYLNQDELGRLQQKLAKQQCEVSRNGISGYQVAVDAKKEQTLLTIFPYSEHCSVLIDGERTTPQSFEGQLAVLVSPGRHTVSVSYHCRPVAIGCVLSVIGCLFWFVWCLNKRSAKIVSRVLAGVYGRLLAFSRGLSDWTKENYVYLLAFLIPFFTFLAAMVYMEAAPFGKYSLFSNDGLHISMPLLYDAIQRFYEGSGVYSWIGGGGRSVTNEFHPFLGLMSLDAMMVYVPMLTIIKISLSGDSMIFYLTHRLYGRRACKKDFRLLIAALCYSMSNYFLLMITFYFWYDAFVLLPLILLGMDHLMMCGKKRYYIISLAACIFLAKYMAMFICFYLVIRFFTYPFQSFADFIKKGCRFALSSLLMLPLCLTVIVQTISSVTNSIYGAEYAGSGYSLSSTFFNRWSYFLRQQMILPEYFNISHEQGAANLYCGVLIVILLLCYLLAKGGSTKEKLRCLLPFGILYFALNHSTLNLIFNGLHHQNGVPNRFAFLLPLMAGVIGYDCIRGLNKKSLVPVIVSVFLVVCAFAYGYIDSVQDRVLTRSLLCSLVLGAVYLVLLLGISLWTKHRRLMYTLLTVVFCAELCVNAFYIISQNKQIFSIMTASKDASNYLKEYRDIDSSLERVSQRSPLISDYALIDRVKSLHLFEAASLTEYQVNAFSCMGGYAANNILTTRHTQTLMGEALGCIRYIIANNRGDYMAGYDLNDYRLVAWNDSSCILENPYCFPFAYYLPKEVLDMNAVAHFNFEVWQNMSSCMNPDQALLVTPSVVYPKKMTEEGESYFEYRKASGVKEEMAIHFSVPTTGYVYAALSDFYFLGFHESGEIIDATLDLSKELGQVDISELMICILDKEVFVELYESISEHPLMITSFTDESIDGTICMPEDGIIQFSMPYDAAWKAYVDGKETEVLAAADAFLAIPAVSGEHSIHIEYVRAKGRLPIIVVCLSWLTFLTAITIKTVKSRRML